MTFLKTLMLRFLEISTTKRSIIIWQNKEKKRSQKIIKLYNEKRLSNQKSKIREKKDKFRKEKKKIAPE